MILTIVINISHEPCPGYPKVETQTYCSYFFDSKIISNKNAKFANSTFEIQSNFSDIK